MNKNMVSLWSGTGSQHAPWKDEGYDIFSCDINPEFEPLVCTDILHLKAQTIIDYFQGQEIRWLWASVDCSVFSVAALSQKHFSKDKNGQFHPNTYKAKYMLERLWHTLDLIRILKPKYWVIENPRALMRKMPSMINYQRHTVTYCQYGNKNMKPTDLFGVFPELWEPKSCKNGDPCHESASRGSNTGTQALSKKEAGMIPYELGKSLLYADIQMQHIFG